MLNRMPLVTMAEKYHEHSDSLGVNKFLANDNTSNSRVLIGAFGANH